MSDSTTRIKCPCPECESESAVLAETLGQAVVCPTCGQLFKAIPGIGQAMVVPKQGQPIGNGPKKGKRSIASRFQSAVITGIGGFFLGATILSRAAGPWEDLKALVLRVVLGLFWAVIAFVVGCFLSKRWATGILIAGIAIASGTFIGAIAGRSAAKHHLETSPYPVSNFVEKASNPPHEEAWRRFESPLGISALIPESWQEMDENKMRSLANAGTKWAEQQSKQAPHSGQIPILYLTAPQSFSKEKSQIKFMVIRGAVATQAEMHANSSSLEKAGYEQNKIRFDAISGTGNRVEMESFNIEETNGLMASILRASVHFEDGTTTEMITWVYPFGTLDFRIVATCPQGTTAQLEQNLKAITESLEVDKARLAKAFENPLLADADADRIFKENNHAVVAVLTYDEHGQPLGQGSGFIVRADGAIVTNYHVIDGATDIKIKTVDEVLEVEGLILADKANDIAILKAKGERLQTVKLGDSESLAIGERVYVISRPRGMANTISDGLLRGNRDFASTQKTLQITAPIQPGSSGGPVFNKDGEVIGIATMANKELQSLNFAMPVNLLKDKITGEKVVALKDAYPGDYKKSAFYWSRLGHAYLSSDKPKEAIESFKQAIKIAPDDAWAHLGLGRAYLKSGKFKETIESYQQVIRIAPDDARAHLNLGGVYLIMKDKESALEEYKILQGLDKEMANKLFKLIYK